MDTNRINNTKKGISCIQGIKNPAQKMVQVLSKLQVNISAEKGYDDIDREIFYLFALPYGFEEKN
jgi:hypothetical protein